MFGDTGDALPVGFLFLFLSLCALMLKTNKYTRNIVMVRKIQNNALRKLDRTRYFSLGNNINITKNTANIPVELTVVIFNLRKLHHRLWVYTTWERWLQLPVLLWCFLPANLQCCFLPVSLRGYFLPTNFLCRFRTFPLRFAGRDCCWGRCQDCRKHQEQHKNKQYHSFHFDG